MPRALTRLTIVLTLLLASCNLPGSIEVTHLGPPGGYRSSRVVADARLAPPTPPREASQPPTRTQHPGRHTPTPRPLTPAIRRAFRRYLIGIAFAHWLAGLPPDSTTVWGAPTPVSSAVCPPGPVHDEINRVFGDAAPWFQSIAWRESGCDPAAYNPSGASGVGQLLGHADLVAQACPTAPDVFNADCNIRASFLLFKASGTAPWRL